MLGLRALTKKHVFFAISNYNEILFVLRLKPIISKLRRTMKKKIGILIGSLRKESFSRKVANVLVAMQSDQLTLEIIEIGGLPMYNEDFDVAPPSEWVSFRDKIQSVAGVIFVTPEYNRSVPAVLKNAIDVGSRPYGKSSWEGKPAGIISISQGAIGGFGANHHLRQSLVFLNMPALQQPEIYIGGIAKLLDQDGKINNPFTTELLHKFLKAFEMLVND